MSLRDRLGPKAISTEDQERIDANRARMAQESKVIDEIIDHLLAGTTVENAVAQVEGATLEQTQAWIAEGRISDPKYFALPYRATDEDLH